MMKIVALVLVVLSVPLAVFSYWGTSTAAGRAKYDEMDGLYPVGAGLVAALLIVAAVALGIVDWAARRSFEGVDGVRVVGE